MAPSPNLPTSSQDGNPCDTTHDGTPAKPETPSNDKTVTWSLQRFLQEPLDTGNQLVILADQSPDPAPAKQRAVERVSPSIKKVDDLTTRLKHDGHH